LILLGEVCQLYATVFRRLRRLLGSSTRIPTPSYISPKTDVIKSQDLVFVAQSV
jgi:hypothetical protein